MCFMVNLIDPRSESGLSKSDNKIQNMLLGNEGLRIL